MARVTVSTGHRSFFSRLLFLIAGLALIVICVKGLALQFFGTTTSATITDVRFDEEIDSDRDYYTTKAYVSYTFEVDGTEYTGSATFSVSSDDQYAKTGVKYLTNYDLKFRETWNDRKALPIKYLPMHPQTSDAEENTKNSVIGTVLRVAGLALALLLIVLAFKPNKKQKVTATYPTPQQTNPYIPNTQQSVPQTPVQASTQMQQTAVPKFCPNCGEKTDGNRFCTNCGNQLT